MFDEIKKIPIFFIRDFRILFTYKIAFSMMFLNTIFNLFYFVLFGSMFNSADIPALSMYGGDYISYLLVGSIGWGFLWSVIGTTSSALRNEMMMGTMESILLTRTKMITMMISYALFGSFFGLLSIIILVIVGFVVFGISAFASANIFTIAIFITSTIMMMGFGMIFGGLTIWQKKVGAAVTLLQNITMFFCGVYFPISVLPTMLHPVRYCIPFYYSMEGLRLSLLSSVSYTELFFYLLMISVFSIVFLVIGMYILQIGLKKAKKDGSLMFY